MKEILMMPRRQCLVMISGIIFALLTVNVPLNCQGLKQHIKGTVNEDVYTNPEKDFRVQVPVYEGLGGAVRDESGKTGDIFLSQVIFSDDLGAFYRVVSITALHKNKIEIYRLLNIFHDIRERQELQTEHGLELRIINIEKAGAEVKVTRGSSSGNVTTVVPDLVTANAIFMVNNRFYHLTVGYPLYDGSTLPQITEQARSKLEHFLAGFETINKK